jgi:hypothetical protein
MPPALREEHHVKIKRHQNRHLKLKTLFKVVFHLFSPDATKMDTDADAAVWQASVQQFPPASSTLTAVSPASTNQFLMSSLSNPIHSEKKALRISLHSLATVSKYTFDPIFFLLV